MFSKIEIAKNAASAVVAGVTGRLVSNLIIANTDLTDDSTTVNVTADVAGMYVAYKARPYTDAAVENTALRIAIYRDSKSSKKQ